MSEKSKNLFIQVLDDGKEKVSLTFPIFTLNILAEVIPEKVKEVIKKRKLDVDSMIFKAKESDYRPQTIFELEDKSKVIKVWIS